MKYPNLMWAIRDLRMAQFELAGKVGISESRLSRAMTGRIVLSADEQTRIGDVLGYSAKWLFRAMTSTRALRRRTRPGGFPE